MMSKAFGLSVNIEKQKNYAKIFGESFQLEGSLLRLLDDSWHLDGYVDEKQVEHIRIYKDVENSDGSELWEVLCYDEGEAPLELLMLQDNV